METPEPQIDEKAVAEAFQRLSDAARAMAVSMKAGANSIIEASKKMRNCTENCTEPE